MRRRDLRVRRADIPLLALFGILGVGAVQLTYYEAIQRLPIGVALVIQYTAPLLLLLHARLTGRTVGARLWLAAALTIGGCALVVGLYDESLRALNAVGALFAIGSAGIFAAYLALAERVLVRYRPWTALVYGLAFASAAWAVARPLWLFPWAEAASVSLLVAGVVLIGTVVPFALTLGAVALISAARVGLTSTFEPVVGSAAALLFLGEVLEPAQVAGGVVVLLGIGIAQSARRTAGGV
ncbi:hypothetical protein BH18CHL2_BH18CHL2_13640 [soil metagenome]